MSPILLAGTALLLGSLHALEADHLAAVTAFAVRRPRAKSAMIFGARWAAGHGAAIVLVGVVLVAAGTQFPAVAEHWLERLVGVVLIGLGAWTMWSAGRLHVHRHRHADGTVHTHLHAHVRGTGHDHGHAITLVGLLHGLAGSGAAVALLPMATIDTPAIAIGYLILFAVGTGAGMVLYGLLAGHLAGRLSGASERLGRVLAVAAGALTIAVGFVWLLA